MYWRNFSKISNLFFQISRCNYVERFILAIDIFFAADFTLKQLMKALYNIPSSIRLKRIVDGLDDVVDGLQVPSILSLGEATLGHIPSPFLSSLLQPEDTQGFARLIREGLITEKELYSFCNLLAYKLYRQAILTLNYNQEHDEAQKKQLRLQITQENIEITGTCFALVAHFSIQKQKLLTIVSEEALTYELVKSIYPQVTRAGELRQIIHDTMEFRYDLSQECVIGKLSPNYLLAQLESKGLLLAESHQINQLPYRSVNLYELPEKIRQVVLEIELMSIKKAINIKRLSGIVLWLSWKYNQYVGFYVEKSRY